MAKPLSPQLLELVAERFRVLADPGSLQLLSALQEGEQTVTELIERTGFRQAKVSKHLQLLYNLGFVDRCKEGLHVYYRLATEDVFLLCDIMRRRLQLEAARRQEVLEELASVGAEDPTPAEAELSVKPWK